MAVSFTKGTKALLSDHYCPVPLTPKKGWSHQSIRSMEKDPKNHLKMSCQAAELLLLHISDVHIKPGHLCLGGFPFFGRTLAFRSLLQCLWQSVIFVQLLPSLACHCFSPVTEQADITAQCLSLLLQCWGTDDLWGFRMISLRHPEEMLLSFQK